MATFDLTTQPWLPVVMADGRCVDVSLEQALLQAHDIVALALADPLEEAAVLRQALLPACLDALGAPATVREFGARWGSGVLDRMALTSYFQEHRHRFDLFSSTAPFAQVAGLRTARNETKSVAVVLPAVPQGNNTPLFNGRTEDDPPVLGPAAAARALLVAHSWDTAAIKSGAVDDPAVAAGKTTGNPTGLLGQLGLIIPLGATLFQTLLLSVPVLSEGFEPGDQPQWRSEPATPAWSRRSARGVLDQLTWQSRRVRLVPELLDGELAVQRVVLCAGDRLEPLSPDVEPHTAWRRVDAPAPGRSPIAPRRHLPGRALWRGMAPLLSTDRPNASGESTCGALAQLARLQRDGAVPEGLVLGVLAVGIQYGQQSAVVEEVFADRIPLPVVALLGDNEVRELLLEAAQQVDAVRRAANLLDDHLRRAGGGEPVAWDRSPRLGDLLLHDVDPVFRRMLAGLRAEPARAPEARVAWTGQLRQLADDVARVAEGRVPPSAFAGRAGQGRAATPPSRAVADYLRSVSALLPRDASIGGTA